MSQLTATQPTAQKPGNIVRLSNDFLQSPGNQYYKAVITVIKVVLEAAGFDTRIEYNVVPLSTFATHTYVYAKKFTATQLMRPLMDVLNKAGIKADIPEPEANKRRFRVSLNIPLALAEKYFEAGMYKVAVNMSPVYENPAPVSPGANGHSHPSGGKNGHAVSPGLEPKAVASTPLTTTPAVSTTDGKVTKDTDVVALVKELSVKNKLAVPGMSTGRVAQADAASILVSVMVSADKLTLARQVFGGAHLQWKECETKESMKGAIIFRFFNGPWKTTAPAATAPKKVVETPLPKPAVTSPAESSPPPPSPAAQIDEPAEAAEEASIEDVELDEEVKEQLAVRHPQSILTATVQRKRQYLTEVVKDHGHGLKLEWVKVPQGEEEKGWRVRESSDQRRNMDLFDLLRFWGYYVSPGPAKPGTEGVHSYQYFLIKRLEPMETAQFFDDGKVARRKDMENLRDRLVPKTDLIPTDQLEEVIDDQLRPNMSANELLMLLRKDILAMSKVANLMHLHELTAESLADLVLEAMVMLRAVPIVESTEMQLSIANGFRVGLAVRLDTFRSMLTERILYLSLSNSMFKFRRDDGEK